MEVYAVHRPPKPRVYALPMQQGINPILPRSPACPCPSLFDHFGSALKSIGQSPYRPSFQGHKAFRHPTSCRKLPLSRSTSWVRDVLVLPPRKGINVAGLW